MPAFCGSAMRFLAAASKHTMRCRRRLRRRFGRGSRFGGRKFGWVVVADDAEYLTLLIVTGIGLAIGAAGSGLTRRRFLRI